MAVRSRRVFGPTLIPSAPTGETVVYTVPAGRTLILHDLFLRTNSATTHDVEVLINFQECWRDTVRIEQSIDVERIILNPGDELAIRNHGLGVSVRATGFGSLLLGGPE